MKNKEKELVYNWSGERLETFIVNDITLEHLHRYAFASNFVKEKKILDIACGEGYGANLLSQYATHVTGIDIDNSSIKKAIDKYTSPNINFKQGSATEIPLPDNSIDVVVSFETLEHLAEHDQMIKEIKRILIPMGLLIMSTPDKLNYSDKNDLKNSFHIKELYENEFRDLIKNYFKDVIFFQQQSSYSSVIIGEKNCQLKISEGDFNQINTNSEFSPYYHIVLASDNHEITGISHLSIFRGLPSYRETVIQAEQDVKNTITYKVGNFFLAPFKAINAFIKKIFLSRQ